MMDTMFEELLEAGTFGGQRCPNCLDWHSAAGDGPYPVELCTLDA